MSTTPHPLLPKRLAEIFNRSPRFSQFITHLSWSFIGIFGASAILFLISTFAGRTLGPHEYDRFGLISTIASIISIISFAGFDGAVVKFGSATNSPAERQALVTNAALVSWTNSALLLIAAYVARNPLSHLLKTDQTVIVLGFVFAWILANKQLAETWFRSNHAFKLQAGAKILEALLALGLFFFFVIKGDHHAGEWYLLATASGAAVFAIPTILSVLKKPHFNREAFTTAKPYIKLTFSVALIGVFVAAIDRLAVGVALGVEKLGIYNAYLLGSSVLVGILATTITNVLLPTMSRIQDKNDAYRKIERTMLICLVPLALFFAAITTIALLLFGKSYPINVLLICLVTLSSLLQLFVNLLGSVAGSSTVIFRAFTRWFFFKPLLLISIYSILLSTKMISIPAVLILNMLDYSYDIVVIRAAIRKHGSPDNNH